MRKVFFIVLMLYIFISSASAAQRPDEPLYPAWKDGKWGYIDAENNWVIETDCVECPGYIYRGQNYTDAEAGEVYNTSEPDGSKGWGITKIKGKHVKAYLLEKLGDNSLVDFFYGGQYWHEYYLFSPDGKQINDQPFCKYELSENRLYAVVATEGMPEDTGMLINKDGRVIRENVPYGKPSDDGVYILASEVDDGGRHYRFLSVETGKELTKQEINNLHASASEAGVWPVWDETDKVYRYQNGQGETDDTLGTYEHATTFSNGFAYVKTLDGHHAVINRQGEIILVDMICDVYGAWDYGQDYYETLIFNDGMLAVRRDDDTGIINGGYNYLQTDGSLLYQKNVLWKAESFFDDRALIEVLLPDYTHVYAYIDSNGRALWAQEGVSVQELQMILDEEKCADPINMTPEKARKILLGDWTCAGGGEHLDYTHTEEYMSEDDSMNHVVSWVTFEDDDTWYVRKRTDSDPFWAGSMVLGFKTDNGQNDNWEIGLQIHNRDLFSVYGWDGGSAYSRKGSKFDQERGYYHLPPIPLYPACKDGKWGYIDSDNNWVIDPQNGERKVYHGYYNADSWIYSPDLKADPDGTMPEDPKYWGVTEINGISPINCDYEKFGRNLFVRFDLGQRNDEPCILFDYDRNRLNDQIYTDYRLSENGQYAIVHTEEMQEGSGTLIDSNGKVIQDNIPYGILSEDGLVVEYRGLYSAITGDELTELEAGCFHAFASEAGVWPVWFDEKDEYCYVNTHGKTDEKLGGFQKATPFSSDFAYVETTDGERLLIDRQGETIVEGVDSEFCCDGLDFRDGMFFFRVDQDEDYYYGGGNYLWEDGTMLFPSSSLWIGEPFCEGRALIGVLLPDYRLVYAHIDTDGRVLWAQDDVSVPELQELLDTGKCPNPSDMTPEEVEEMLIGTWNDDDEYQLLGDDAFYDPENDIYNISFEKDGTWYVRESMEEERNTGEAGLFVLCRRLTGEDEKEYIQEFYLEMHSRDLFEISIMDNLNGYVNEYIRRDSTFDPWK